MYRILIADDDTTMLQMVEEILDSEGYIVYTACTVEEVLDLVATQSFDLFLLDFAMGDSDSLEMCRQLRQNPDTADKPIVFLTGQFESQYAIEALNAGADDYIRKPFAVKELTARIRAHLRRVKPDNRMFPMLRLCPDTYQVFLDSREVHLTRIEFSLLYFMVGTSKRWLATQELLEGVWRYPDGVGDTALVRNHIRNLRRKLESDPDRPTIIQSRHGRGYTIRAQVFVNSTALSS